MKYFSNINIRNLKTPKVNDLSKVTQLASDIVQGRILLVLRIAVFFIWQSSLPDSVDLSPNSKRQHFYLTRFIFMFGKTLSRKKIGSGMQLISECSKGSS